MLVCVCERWRVLFLRRCLLLSESSVEASIRKVLSECEQNEETFDRVEEMLDELRPESPLRHRLSQELDELRALAASGK